MNRSLVSLSWIWNWDQEQPPRSLLLVALEDSRQLLGLTTGKTRGKEASIHNVQLHHFSFVVQHVLVFPYFSVSIPPFLIFSICVCMYVLLTCKLLSCFSLYIFMYRWIFYQVNIRLIPISLENVGYLYIICRLFWEHPSQIWMNLIAPFIFWFKKNVDYYGHMACNLP